MRIVQLYRSAVRAAKGALTKIEQWVRRDARRELVAVFDIDDTLLLENWWSFRVNKAVVKLYNALKQRRCALYLVTARNDIKSSRNFTARQLKLMGIGGFTKVYHTPNVWRKNSATISQFKLACRARIAARHRCPIALTVGDSWSDIIGVRHGTDLCRLDRVIRAPYVLVRPGDRMAAFGLKLRATH